MIDLAESALFYAGLIGFLIGACEFIRWATGGPTLDPWDM